MGGHPSKTQCQDCRFGRRVQSGTDDVLLEDQGSQEKGCSPSFRIVIIEILVFLLSLYEERCHDKGRCGLHRSAFRRYSACCSSIIDGVIINHFNNAISLINIGQQQRSDPSILLSHVNDLRTEHIFAV